MGRGESGSQAGAGAGAGAEAGAEHLCSPRAPAEGVTIPAASAGVGDGAGGSVRLRAL